MASTDSRGAGGASRPRTWHEVDRWTWKESTWKGKPKGWAGGQQPLKIWTEDTAWQNLWRGSVRGVQTRVGRGRTCIRHCGLVMEGTAHHSGKGGSGIRLAWTCVGHAPASRQGCAGPRRGCSWLNRQLNGGQGECCRAGEARGAESLRRCRREGRGMGWWGGVGWGGVGWAHCAGSVAVERGASVSAAASLPKYQGPCAACVSSVSCLCRICRGGQTGWRVGTTTQAAPILPNQNKHSCAPLPGCARTGLSHSTFAARRRGKRAGGMHPS